MAAPAVAVLGVGYAVLFQKTVRKGRYVLGDDPGVNILKTIRQAAAEHVFITLPRLRR